MEQQSFLPVLDNEALQKKANEYAMKGATQAFEDFYCGYNSPYKKAISADLENKDISYHFELPDIIARINDSLTQEIDKIANEALSKSFIPLVNRFLKRQEKNIKFSDILKEFVNSKYSPDRDEVSCDIREHAEHNWLDVLLTHKDEKYKFTLHLVSKKGDPKKYKSLSLPYDKGDSGRMMKLKVENATLELPFTSDILKDNFMSFMANLILSDSEITIDEEDFDDESFDHCHC
jgi:hypothetical protein